MCQSPLSRTKLYWKHSMFFWHLTVVSLVFCLCGPVKFGAVGSLTGSAPTWVDSMLRVEYSLLAGDDLELECRARGRPKPTVQWYKDGKLLTNSSRYNDQPIISSRWRLTVPDLMPHDEGNYTCVVDNEHGQLEHSYRVAVIVRHITPPTFSRKPRNSTVREGEKVVLHCETDSELNVYTQWLRRIELEEASETIRYRRLATEGRIRVSDRQLVIVNATLNDSGLYSCYVANQKGGILADALVTVTAVESEKELNSPNVFIVPVLVVSVAAGLIAVLICVLKCRNSKKRPTPRSATRCTGLTTTTTTYTTVIGSQNCTSRNERKAATPLTTDRDEITAV